MSRVPEDPLGVSLLVAGAFDRYRIPYAIGGALAYGFWAVPRGTLDVDVNVFLSENKLDLVFDALESLGIAVPREQARAENSAKGMFTLQWDMYRLDVFTPSIAFSWEAHRTRISQTVDGQEIWLLSPEALAVFKLLFFRVKDIADLERLVAVQGDRLDAAYVRRHIVEMMGEDDARVLRWDGILAK